MKGQGQIVTLTYSPLYKMYQGNDGFMYDADEATQMVELELARYSKRSIKKGV